MKNFGFSFIRCPLTFTVVLLLSNFVISVLTQSEECETLPPPSKMSVSTNLSSNSHQYIKQEDKIQQILIEGMDQLHFDKDDKKAIFMLGNTGSGKTTITQTLNGNLSQLHAVLTHSGQMVIIDDQNRIGLPTTRSKTLVPEYIRNPENNVSFYDCPGFDDNRGAEADIAAMYFVNAITEHVEQAKFLFVVTHSSLIMGHNRLDFDLLATHASHFLLNMTKFSDSIGLIVSKVSSYSAQGRYISDKGILTGIVDFLCEFRSTLQQNLQEAELKEQDLLQRKIHFVEAILAQNGNGNYTKIWFVRSPPQCGAFSKMPYYTEVREKVANLYANKLVYSSTVSSDFGITLKDKTLLKISREYVPQFLDEYTNKTEEIIDELFAKYKHKFEEDFTTDDKFRESLLKLNTVYHNLSVMLNQNQSHTLSKDFKKLILTMEQKVPKVHANELKKIRNVVKFYEKVTMSTIAKPSISPSIQKFQTKVRELRNKAFSFITNTSIPNMFSNISTVVTNLVGEAEEMYLQTFYHDLNRITMSGKVEVMKNDKQKMLLFRNEWESGGLSSISIEIGEVYSKLGYSIPPDQIEELGQLENVLDFLGEVMASPIQRPIEEWLRIPLKLFRKLEHLHDWYEFLGLTDDKLMFYGTQREISSLRAINTISTFDASMNILKNVPGSFLSSNILNIAENHVNEVDKTKLVNIVRNAFTPTKIECLSNGRKAAVTGNFVKFTDFITSSGELPCGSNLEELEVFASEKLFFDRDTLAIGRGLTIRVIAEVWEVIDTRTIDLKGANGEPHSPAKAQGFSVNGKPGGPGGNGGNFHGIYCTIVNGQNLTVNVNGGDAGDGQEGGNGKEGVNGRDAARGDFPEPQNRHSVSWESKGSAREYGVHFEQRHIMAGGLGEVGGNGGNGGSGGEAGYPGTVSINRAQPYPASNNSQNDILVRSQRGNPGLPGKGGEKGVGGRKGHSYSCLAANTVFKRYWSKCRVEHRNEVAASGRDGITGSNSEGKIYPTQPTPFAGKISSETVSDFKNFMLESGSCTRKIEA